MLDMLLEALVVVHLTNHSVRVKNGVLRIHRSSVDSGCPDQLIHFTEANDRRSGLLALLVQNDFWFAFLYDSNARKSRAKIDTCS